MNGMRIGIIGGGQLGMMLTEAALPLGFEVIVLDPSPQNEAPAAKVGAQHLVGDLADSMSIMKLASKVDFLTWEIEHINVEILKELKRGGTSINPDPETLETIKDKLTQKQFLVINNIPTAPFWGIEKIDDVYKFAEKFGVPFLLKNRFGGFDGRGNYLVKNKKEIETAFDNLGGQNLYAEGFINFEKELAFISARDIKGKIKSFPIVETVHENNICDTVIFPARVSKETGAKAERVGKDVMKQLQGAGVFVVEMFVDKDGKVFVNEIAPRVHNSGHLTIEAFSTSQFEQHIRAITEMELGSTKLKNSRKPVAVMKNILYGPENKDFLSGIEISKIDFSDEKIKDDDVFLHSYCKSGRGKKVPRKIGHITVLGNDLDNVVEKINSVYQQIERAS